MSTSKSNKPTTSQALALLSLSLRGAWAVQTNGIQTVNVWVPAETVGKDGTRPALVDAVAGGTWGSLESRGWVERAPEHDEQESEGARRRRVAYHERAERFGPMAEDELAAMREPLTVAWGWRISADGRAAVDRASWDALEKVRPDLARLREAVPQAFAGDERLPGRPEAFRGRSWE